MLYILLQSIMSKESLNNTINDLYERYKDDSVILNKLVNHITHDLPSLLINTKKQQKTREDRRILLQEAHDKFVNQFIKKNIYFYCNTSEIFFAYDSSHYSTIKEDTIIHTILSALSLRDNHDQEQILYFEKQLLPWKFKIKTSIIKQVRDSFILSSIPESSTIQNILNIFMNIFETKAESKYFLSIIGAIISIRIVASNDYEINYNFM